MIYVFNIHLDHIGVKARKKSLGVIKKKIREINQEKHPFVVMGDFNAIPEDKVIRSFSKKYIDAASTHAESPIKLMGTFNAFDLDTPAERRIDYIFLDKENFEIEAYRLLEEPAGHSYPSDHFPVIVDVSIKH